jgi:hypothetical protein
MQKIKEYWKSIRWDAIEAFFFLAFVAIVYGSACLVVALWAGLVILVFTNFWLLVLGMGAIVAMIAIYRSMVEGIPVFENKAEHKVKELEKIVDLLSERVAELEDAEDERQ